jgi:peptide/nickel transport system substrate-binding protein
MLSIIKEDMAKAGVVMKIQAVEWSVLTQRLENKSFEACTLGWTQALAPDPMQLWHSKEAETKGSSNHIGFKSKEADELIEEIRVTFDLQKRIKLCHEFHRLLHDLQPYTFLVSPNALQAINRRYKNVRVFSTGIPDKIMWVPRSEQKTVPGLN